MSSEVLDAGERLRRLLAVLAYLARVGEARIDELSRRFDIDPAVLVSELELAACCGLPPYTPDQLLELVVDGETVRAYGLDALRQPPRLTPDEGFALAASARALLAVPGAESDGPLARALRKLEAVLGDDRVHIELDQPAHLRELRRAAAECEVIEIDYLGAKRGDETTREVEPYSVVARDGRFYLDGFCRLANDWRRFRVDRIAAVRPTGEHGVPKVAPPELGGVRSFAGGPSATSVRLAVPATDRIALERFAIAPIENLSDGRVVLTIEIGDPDFLGRLLLRLGNDVEVLEPESLRAVASEVAKRAHARYVPVASP